MAPAFKPDTDSEHPFVAWAGIVAVLVAIVLILWARFEIHGTQDLEAALQEAPAEPAAGRGKPSPGADSEVRREADVEDAVAAGRWAAGVAP